MRHDALRGRKFGSRFAGPLCSAPDRLLVPRQLKSWSWSVTASRTRPSCSPKIRPSRSSWPPASYNTISAKAAARRSRSCANRALSTALRSWSARAERLGLRSADFVQREYLVEVRDKTLILMGLDTLLRGDLNYEGDLVAFTGLSHAPLGSCHAVHSFLEKFLDVRRYLPTELGEVVPHRKTIEIPPSRSADGRPLPTSTEINGASTGGSTFMTTTATVS